MWLILIYCTQCFAKSKNICFSSRNEVVTEYLCYQFLPIRMWTFRFHRVSPQNMIRYTKIDTSKKFKKKKKKKKREKKRTRYRSKKFYSYKLLTRAYSHELFHSFDNNVNFIDFFISFAWMNIVRRLPKTR